MPRLPDQFADAKRNVEPRPEDVDNASKAHEVVREALEASDDLKDARIDTVLIGSYARHVSIHRMRDVDVLSKLPDLDSDDPDALLDTFEEVLVDEFGKQRIERQDRSIKVDFPAYDLAVDAVPARSCGDHWEIPDGSGGWQETNPLKLASLTSDMNAEHDEHYVPTVKLIRQVRRAQLGDTQPGGLYLEVATYHSFDLGIDADGTAEYFTAALEGVADILADAASNGLDDPTLSGHKIATRASDDELRDAADVFAGLASDARQALVSEDACPAAKTFRDMLGKNSDGTWVFPMPSYCNDDGTLKSSGEGLVAGSSRIRGGDSRYA